MCFIDFKKMVAVMTILSMTGLSHPQESVSKKEIADFEADNRKFMTMESASPGNIESIKKYVDENPESPTGLIMLFFNAYKQKSSDTAGYFTRASKILDKIPDTETGKELKSLYFYTCGNILLNEKKKNYSKIKQLADTSYKYEKNIGKKIYREIAYSYVLQGNNMMASQFYKLGFENEYDIKTAGTEHLLNYIIIKFNSGNKDEARSALTALKEYISRKDARCIMNFGTVAGTVFELNEKYEMTFMSAFLEYELSRCYKKSSETEFLKLIKSMIPEYSKKAGKDLTYILDFYKKYFSKKHILTHEDLDVFEEETKNYYPVRFMYLSKQKMTEQQVKEEYDDLYLFFNMYPSFFYMFADQTKGMKNDMHYNLLHGVLEVDKNNGFGKSIFYEKAKYELQTAGKDVKGY